MSTKTLRKRIALVAVAALGAGVLSVAPANAAALSLDVSAATKYPNVCSTTDGTTTTAASGTADTAVVKVGGRVDFTSQTATTTTDDVYVDLTGPGTLTLVETDTTFNTSGQAVLADDGDVIGVTATAVGTIKVSFRNSSTGSAALVATITVVATCANGTPSLAYSFAQIVDKDDTEAFGTRSMTNNVDMTDENVVDATSSSDGVGFIRAKLKDAYNATLPSTGVVQVTATGDVTVGVDTNATSGGAYSASASAKTWIGSGTGEDLGIAVAPFSGAPTTSTVTISYNGTVMFTKTFTFLGAPSKVTYVGGAVGKSTSGSNVGTLQFQIVDAAGNPLGGRNVANDSTYNAAAVAVTSGITAGSDTTSAVTGKTAALTSANAATFTCTTKGGTAQLQAKVAVDAAQTEFIYTAPFTVACGGELDTWTASLDKATYAPGEIATLTISGKDSSGYAVYSALAIGAAVASFGGMEFVTAPTDTDKFSSGVGTKTYTLRVLTTEGSYVGSYKATGATDTSAKTLQYKVAAASGAVSMADVLKAIVSLIASINKQIAALQKALLKK